LVLTHLWSNAEEECLKDDMAQTGAEIKCR
jgi:hypothetical protein